ncbi:hypothetical protein AVEN_28567-1, partial [Araneus ventricosus]
MEALSLVELLQSGHRSCYHPHLFSHRQKCFEHRHRNKKGFVTGQTVASGSPSLHLFSHHVKCFGHWASEMKDLSLVRLLQSDSGSPLSPFCFPLRRNVLTLGLRNERKKC